MNISAVLLAGGESRRMGRDKAAILFRGKALWQIQLDLLRILNPKDIMFPQELIRSGDLPTLISSPTFLRHAGHSVAWLRRWIGCAALIFSRSPLICR